MADPTLNADVPHEVLSLFLSVAVNFCIVSGVMVTLGAGDIVIVGTPRRHAAVMFTLTELFVIKPARSVADAVMVCVPAESVAENAPPVPICPLMLDVH